MLTVLLADVGEVAAAVDDGWAAEVLGVGEQRAPLRLQQVDHAQILAELLELRAGCGQEVHMRVARIPACGCEIYVPSQAQGKVPLAGLDPDRLAQRFVLETPRDVDQHVTARKPALAGAVDVRVRRLAEAYVAADVLVPAAEVLVDVLVVAVRLVRHARGERKCTRHGTGLPVASSRTVTCTQLRPGSTSSTRTRSVLACPSRSTSLHRTAPSSVPS